MYLLSILGTVLALFLVFILGIVIGISKTEEKFEVPRYKRFNLFEL